MNIENVVVWIRQPYETEVVKELNKHSTKFNVLRRCADVADARSTIQAGLSRILIVDADALGVDASFIDDMNQAGAFTLLLVEDALTTPNLGESARCEYGNPADLIQTLTLGVKQHLFGIETATDEIQTLEDTPVIHGKTIAIWGTHGAPGRSTIALNLAYQMGQAELPTVLIDADLQAPTQIQMIGAENGTPGISAALGLRNRGELTFPVLTEIMHPISEKTSLLPGLNRADRWRQISAEGIQDLLQILSRKAHSVIDLGAGLGEADPTQLTFVPSREDINYSILENADIRIVVARADAIGLTRLANLIDECEENSLQIDLIIINRAGAKDRKLKHALNRILNQIAPNKPFLIIEETPDVAQALLAGTPVMQNLPHSTFTKTINGVVKYLLDTHIAVDMAQ